MLIRLKAGVTVPVLLHSMSRWAFKSTLKVLFQNLQLLHGACFIDIVTIVVTRADDKITWAYR